MGLFDFFQKKNVSDTTDLSNSVEETNIEVTTEEQSKTEDRSTISWDTLSFGVSDELEKSEKHHVPQTKIVSQENHRTYEDDASSTIVNFKSLNDIQLAPIEYSGYVFPKTDILRTSNPEKQIDDSVYKERLEAIFLCYGVNARVMSVAQTDMAITFGISPHPGVRIKSITSYKEEYALALGGRIEFEIPLKGTSYLGLRVFKENKGEINLRKMLESDEYRKSEARIPLLMGASVSGVPIIEDLDEISHLLIGGETGSGKSVFLNSLILGMLYKRSPEDIRFILIDTNVLNFNVYNGIPSMLLPVITDSNKATEALSWCSTEISRRMDLLLESGIKDIDDYNKFSWVARIPHIVVMIDEFAPVTESDEGLDALLSIANLGKAAGVHLIISTQKISSKIALRRIKESIHARVAFDVFGETESRAFLDMTGAESLSGTGDMVYRKPGQNSLVKIQGINVKDSEVSACVYYIKDHNSSIPESEPLEFSTSSDTYEEQFEYDELLKKAGQYVISSGMASIGNLQRKFRIGFNRAARIMDQLSAMGVVGSDNGAKPRNVLMSLAEFEDIF